ncbi:MAG: vitamin epoxide reductase family protein [Candidatus Adlerbacteria bacterium]|nr:vitamin epoxide reductase family protein [Candidatus Adlerbacteria bacterium]
MQPKVFLAPFYIIAAALIGIGDTLYLAYFHILGIVPSCAIMDGCEKVLTSPYSNFYDVPLAYLGLVYYVYMVCLAVLLAFDPTSKGLRWGMMLYATIGLAFSIFFELFQFFVIGALCMYCAISATVALVLFGLALWHIKSTKKI